MYIYINWSVGCDSDSSLLLADPGAPDLGAVPLTCIGNLGHHSWPQRHHDGKGNENPDAVGHDEDEELLEGGVPHAVRSSPAAVREGVKIEKCFPEGHDRNREGQRDGVPTGPVVLQQMTKLSKPSKLYFSFPAASSLTKQEKYTGKN